MAKLVSEDTHAAVLGLDGVLADPVVAVSDLDAAVLVEGRAGCADQVGVGIPAVAPDGLGAQCPAASLFTLARMHRLASVDVAVRLAKAAVAVVVSAVPLVEVSQGGVALGRVLAGRDLRGVPAIDGIPNEQP